MLLELTTTMRPATDLGYLLHKPPARVRSFDLGVGRAHVFYPEASAERRTASLVLDVDPVRLVRGRRGPEGQGGRLRQYVNDRPYVASSFLSVAIGQVLRSALKGESRERPELAARPRQAGPGAAGGEGARTGALRSGRAAAAGARARVRGARAGERAGAPDALARGRTSDCTHVRLLEGHPATP